MTELFGRAYRVLINNELEITGLHVSFAVRRSFKPEPDTLELNIYNLNEDHRGQLQKQKVVPVQLEAGYAPPSELSAGAGAALDDIGVGAQSSLPVLFKGDLREVASTREGPDWVTTISSGDGDKAKKKRLHKSFGPGATLSFAIAQIASELGVGVGELPVDAQTMKLFKRGRSFQSGVVLSGNGFWQLTRMLDAAEFEWTIQGGRIVVLEKGTSVRGQAVLLSPETGLVGSPSPSSDHRVKFRALLQPDLVPGRQAKFEARHVTGYYRIETVSYTGDMAGGDWYADGEAKAL